jgi:hypothetical protein
VAERAGATSGAFSTSVDGEERITLSCAIPDGNGSIRPKETASHHGVAGPPGASRGSLRTLARRSYLE